MATNRKVKPLAQFYQADANYIALSRRQAAGRLRVLRRAARLQRADVRRPSAEILRGIAC